MASKAALQQLAPQPAAPIMGWQARPAMPAAAECSLNAGGSWGGALLITCHSVHCRSQVFVLCILLSLRTFFDLLCALLGSRRVPAALHQQLQSP